MLKLSSINGAMIGKPNSYVGVSSLAHPEALPYFSEGMYYCNVF